MNETKSSIVIIDDEAPIRRFLAITLESRNYKVADADTGSSGASLTASLKPDLVILDLGLPDMDGKEVIRHIRCWSQIPIIVCSVRDNDTEVISAMEMGADDYVTKPFNPDVLLARINSNIRRAATQIAGEPDIVNGNIRMDLVRHEVFMGDQKVSLTPREYKLLRYFMLNRGKMLTHKQILKEVWGPAHTEDMQYLRVYVSQLREKIDNSIEVSCIFTEPGIGYRMDILDNSSVKDPAEPLRQAACG